MNKQCYIDCVSFAVREKGYLGTIAYTVKGDVKNFNDLTIRESVYKDRPIRMVLKYALRKFVLVHIYSTENTPYEFSIDKELARLAQNGLHVYDTRDDRFVRFTKPNWVMILKNEKFLHIHSYIIGRTVIYPPVFTVNIESLLLRPEFEKTGKFPSYITLTLNSITLLKNKSLFYYDEDTRKWFIKMHNGEELPMQYRGTNALCLDTLYIGMNYLNQQVVNDFINSLAKRNKPIREKDVATIFVKYEIGADEDKPQESGMIAIHGHEISSYNRTIHCTNWKHFLTN